MSSTETPQSPPPADEELDDTLREAMDRRLNDAPLDRMRKRLRATARERAEEETEPSAGAGDPPPR